MGSSVRILPVFFLQNFGLSPHDPLGQIQAVGTFDVFLEFLLHSRKFFKQTLDFFGEPKRIFCPEKEFDLRRSLTGEFKIISQQSL